MQNGVWFTAASPTGPWAAATSVPPEIYSIPVSSPLHYVTYVYVYDSTPTVVYTGYTPGYLGTCVSTDDTVVYGTGYAYAPWCDNIWVGCPWTYGFSAGFSCDAFYGFGFGFAVSPWFSGCRPRPWWGPFDWARRHHDGELQPRRPRPREHLSALGQRGGADAEPVRGKPLERPGLVQLAGAVQSVLRAQRHRRRAQLGSQRASANRDQSAHPPARNARGARAGDAARLPAATPSNSVFAGHSGEVFRAMPNKNWEALTSKGWESARQVPAFRSEAPTLNREQTARDIGSQRFSNWQSSGGFAPRGTSAPGGTPIPSGRPLGR